MQQQLINLRRSAQRFGELALRGKREIAKLKEELAVARFEITGLEGQVANLQKRLGLPPTP